MQLMRNSEAILYYDSSSNADKSVLAYTTSHAEHIRTVDIHNEPLNPTLLAELCHKMAIEPIDLLDRHRPGNSELLADRALTDDHDTLTLIVHNPSLLCTPILVTQSNVGFATNAQTVAERLDAERDQARLKSKGEA